jgi:glycosyltransferase involved in cell wall biosynthesis
MNVLHINQSDISGGAAIAAHRLHQGLLNQGINSRLLVGKVQTQSDLIAAIPRRPRLEHQLSRFTRAAGLNYLHILGAFDIPKHNFYQDADILNFHNLHSGHFNYLAIPALTKHKPAVITLHDMWSFTGHCAYSYDCDRWKTGCGQCPYPDRYPAIRRDNTHLEWRLKKWIYQHTNVTIVTLSTWLTDQAKQSILNQFPIHKIANGIDTDIYQPLDTKHCRAKLGIPDNKKVLMFAAHRLTNYTKGGDLLLKALQSLPQSLKSEIILLTIGTGEAHFEAFGIQSLNLGYVSDDQLKAISYSAADLFVFPTRADNLPLVLQESMACGTPMVSFKIGGVPDLVRPGIRGYLAEPEDFKDFSSGIVQLLEDNDQLQQMGQRCRQVALREYSLHLQITKYIDLYNQILQN